MLLDTKHYNSTTHQGLDRARRPPQRDDMVPREENGKEEINGRERGKRQEGTGGGGGKGKRRRENASAAPAASDEVNDLLHSSDHHARPTLLLPIQRQPHVPEARQQAPREEVLRLRRRLLRPRRLGRRGGACCSFVGARRRRKLLSFSSFSFFFLCCSSRRCRPRPAVAPRRGGCGRGPAQEGAGGGVPAPGGAEAARGDP